MTSSGVLHFLLFGAALLLGAGCGGVSTQSAATHTQPAALRNFPVLQNGLPALPPDQALDGAAPHQTSVNLSLTLDGVDFFATNAPDIAGSSLPLRPNTDELPPLVWAIYRLPGLAPDAAVTTLSAGLGQQVPGEAYYFGLADYQRGGWQLFTKTAESAGAIYNFATEFDAAHHLSPNGNVFLAVLAHDYSCNVDFVSLVASTSLAAPQNLDASDGSDGSAVHIRWDTVPGAELYDVFYKESSQPDDFYGYLATATGDTDSPGFDHTATQPPGKTAVYGTEYEYKVRATAEGEDPSLFSAPDAGTRRLPTPYDLQASDRLSEDYIYVSWRSPDASTELRSFELHRDDIFGPLPSFTQVGNAFIFIDLLDDFAEHEYYVVEIGPEGNSLPSQVDIGSTGKWEDQLVATLGLQQRFYADMEPSAHDPSVAAVCFAQDDTKQLMYGLLSQDAATITQVVQAELDGTADLANHLGRPWIAYDNNDLALAPLGIYIARGKVAQPLGDGDWDVYLVSDAELRSNNVVLDIVGGRLALVFLEFVEPGDYQLHYAYALTDDPLGAADWADTSIASYPDNSLGEVIDLAEWQGLPLVAQLGDEGALIQQAATLAPAGEADWTSYQPPLNGRVVGRGQGVQLVVEGGQLYLATLQGGAEAEGQLLVTIPQHWPPGELDWNEKHFFDSSDESYGGLSMMFSEGRPFLGWSSDRNDGPVVGFPAMVAEQELTWNTQYWPAIFRIIDEKYDRCVQELVLRKIDGELAMLSVCRFNDDGDIKFDLLYSAVAHPGG